MKIGETPISEQERIDKNTIGIDDTLSGMPLQEVTMEKKEFPKPPLFSPPNDDDSSNKRVLGNTPNSKSNATPSDYNEQENMEIMRGGLNVGGSFKANNRNEANVKDPSQLGGSRYNAHKLKGKEADISQKHIGLGDLSKGDRIKIETSEKKIKVIKDV